MIASRSPFILLIAMILSFRSICLGQLKKDSAVYWVNQNYINCIDSGNSVCRCEKQNNFLILSIDTELNKLIINPSIYHSWETLNLDIKKEDQISYSILPTYGVDSGSILKITSNQLSIKTPKDIGLFTKIKVKRLDNWVEGDLWRQVGVINCKPLSKYSFSSCSDKSNLLLAPKEFSNLILEGRITISCSDDYYYDEMHINKSETEFFLIYEKDAVKIYKIPARDKGDKVDIANLKDCQILHKNR
jgi:hypothetical protein